MSNRYGLYAAEYYKFQDVDGKPMPDGRHAFLLLAREDEGGQPQYALEELHFYSPTDSDYIRALLKSPQRDLSQLELFHYRSGTPEEIIPLWKQAVQVGLAVNSIDIEFSASASNQINCQSGVSACLERMGINFHIPGDMRLRIPGWDSNLIDRIEIFGPEYLQPIEEAQYMAGVTALWGKPEMVAC